MARTIGLAKKFFFQFLFRSFVTAHRNERSRSPWTCLMDTVGKTLLARTRFALEQDVIIPAGDAGGLMLQGLELAGITDHTVKAVAGTVSRGVGNGGLQILDGHGDDDDTVDTAAVIDGQDARHIFIGTVLGNPRDFLTDRLLAIKTFLYRNMFIVQEDIFHTGPLIHAQTGPVIGVAQGAIPVDPENSCRDVFGDDVADLPVFNHLEVIFNGILHGHEQAEQDVIRQVILVQAEHGQKVSILSIHTDGGGAGITGMAFADPHFRSEHQEGNIVAAGHRKARRTTVLFEHTHALNIINAPLEERQGIVFEDIPLFINDDHGQVMGVKILLILFKKSIHISQDIFMQLQLPGQFIGRKAHPISRHGLMVLFTGIAATPRLSDPRMDIGIDDALFNELIIITRQFFLIASFPNHELPPSTC